MEYKRYIRSDIPYSEQAINAIIRPPRKEYDISEIPMTLTVDSEDTFIRFPVSFVNKRNETIVGSIYHSTNCSPFSGGPCAIYLHGNASSQLEGQFLVPNLCSYGIFVFCFDFCGCGNSGGKYISLGYFEKQDTEYLMSVLHTQFNLGPFVLWGRSMGAAAALLVQHPLLVGRIADSSFTSVRDMCLSIAKSMNFPNVFVPAVIWYLKKKVLSAANFDFSDVEPISITNDNCPELMPNGEVPAVFGHAGKDNFIPYSQCEKLYNHYGNKKKYLMKLPGGHNSKRNEHWLRLGIAFTLDQFNITVDDLIIKPCSRLQESTTFHFSDFLHMVEQTPKAQSDFDSTNTIITKYMENPDGIEINDKLEDEITPPSSLTSQMNIIPCPSDSILTSNDCISDDSSEAEMNQSYLKKAETEEIKATSDH